MKVIAELGTSESASVDWRGVEMRRRMWNRIDMIAVTHVIDVRRCMWDEHASRVNAPVSCVRHQMSVRCRVRHRIYVVAMPKVVDVCGCMRYGIVVSVSGEYLSRSRLGCAKDSDDHQTKENVSHHNAPSN